MKMSRRKIHEDALGVAGAETVIGTGVLVKGNLQSSSDITIDGTLDGSVKVEGNITLGINSVVKANLEAANVTIAGNLVGDIHASGEVRIMESGQVKGNIMSSGLAITPGGVFIGQSVMDQPPTLGVELPSIDETAEPPNATKRRKL